MRILATLAGAASLFPSIPSNPNINSFPPFPPLPPLPPLTLPLRKQKHRPLPSPPYPRPSPSSSSHNSLRSSSSEDARAVLIGDSGVSYVLPGAPFEFQYSYSETPKDKPLAIRQPAFLPFAPQVKSLPWTGKTPRLSKKTKRKKNRKKKIRLFQPHAEDSVPPPGTSMVLKMACRRSMELGRYIDGRTREDILGDPLTHSEVTALVEPYLSSNNQVNLGRDGLTHNMLELIHSHWRRKEVCRVRCRGVPTMDMDNICYHLEEKTGGKVINQIGGVVYLFRGRNYNPRTRPRCPVMLLKPPVPVYPKLIHETPEGLTKEEADELRIKGKNLLPICKLAKNGVFLSLVSDVKDAFELSHLVKVNCQVLKPKDHIKIGVKLKNLVPCVLLSFDDMQILMWRGKDWQSRYSMPFSLITKTPTNAIWTSSSGESGGSASAETPSLAASSSKMMALWKQALESNRALLLLDGTELIPDSLLERVEDFERTSEAANSLNDSSKVDSADITTCKS